MRNDIREHMEVISADGVHVGMVDKVDGHRLKLTKSDRGVGDKHYYVSVGLIAGVEDEKVRLSTTSENIGSFLEI
jgi:hypothetical protein